MLKKVFVLLTLVVLILIVAMALTKPDPMLHQEAVRQMAMNIVNTELTRAQLPEEYAVNANSEAMNKVNSYLQGRMEVDDYVVVSVGRIQYHGKAYPITLGTFGKVFVLTDEEQVRQLFLKGWSSNKLK